MHVLMVALFPVPCPAFRCLQYGKALFRTASNEKLGVGQAILMVHADMSLENIACPIVIYIGTRKVAVRVR